jgi:hypothetical protein
MCREASHRFFFAVNEERPLRTGLLLPSQQVGLIRMGGETVDV